MAATARTATRTGTRLAARGSGIVGLEVLADEAGIHPLLARRLVAMGLIDPTGGTTAAPLFRRGDAAELRRALRLRRDLGLNYAGAVLAVELLARIDELERRLQRERHEVITWTRTA